MSVSPAQNFSKPPPVPEVPTVTLTPCCSSLKSSAAAVVRGATVLDPSALTAPDSAFVSLPALAVSVLLSPPQAVRTSAPATTAVARRV